MTVIGRFSSLAGITGSGISVNSDTLKNGAVTLGTESITSSNLIAEPVRGTVILSENFSPGQNKLLPVISFGGKQTLQIVQNNHVTCKWLMA